MSEEIQNAVMAFLEKKRKIKTRHPLADIIEGVKEHSRKEVKMTIMDMSNKGILKVWSSGSSSYYMLPDDFEKLTNAGADGQA